MKKPRLQVVRGGKRTVRLSTVERQYFASLHRFIDEVFEAATNEFDWSWSEFATAAQLCDATVSNLGNRQTHYPRYFTIYKLAKAVGRELKLEKLKTTTAVRGLKVAAG
jgi:hypothetical protein